MISKEFQAILDTARMPYGGAILRVALAGGFAWQGASGPFGARPARAIRPEDSFRTASVTKTFTTALVLRLCERGALDLAQPVLALLPAEIGKGWLDPAITVEQLVNHSSGLPDYAKSAPFVSRVFAQPAHQWQAGELLEIARGLGPPLFAPGTGQQYSDTGYVLLALLLAELTGSPLASLYQEIICRPLGMAATWLEGETPAAQAVPLSHPYASDGTDTRNFNPSFDTWGGGGLVSTAHDLGVFAAALFGGSFFERPATLERMQRIPGAALHPERYEAAGCYRINAGPHTFWGHFGHWGAFMLHEQQLGLTVSGTLNCALGPDSRRVLPARLHLQRLATLADQYSKD
jgi:D-alanyl-D-alanine carboxypeptidase